MTDDEKANHVQDALLQMIKAQRALKTAHKLLKLGGRSLSADYINGLVSRVNRDIEFIREVS